MSGYTMSQAEVLWAGPLAYQAAGAATTGWPAAAAAVTTAQSLIAGATGASGAAGWDQASLPAGFWKYPRQHVKIIASGIMSYVATAGTTATFNFGLAAASNSITAAPNLIASPAYANQTLAATNVPWRFEIDLLCSKVGYGTTAVSTELLVTGVGGYTPAIVGAVGAVPTWGPLAPQVVTTVDASVASWIYATITFGTNASASNSCTMLNMLVYGMN